MSVQLDERYEARELDLGLLYARIRSRKLWVVASMVLCTGAFAAAAFLLPPVYRASVVLAPASADRGGMSGGLGSALGPLTAGIVIGVSEAVTMAFASPSWAPIVSFSLLIALLLLRPGKS